MQAKVILGASEGNSYSAALNRTSTLVREVTATDAWASRKPHFWFYGSYQWGKTFAPGAAVLRDGPLTLVRLTRPHPTLTVTCTITLDPTFTPTYILPITVAYKCVVGSSDNNGSLPQVVGGDGVDACPHRALRQHGRVPL